MNTTPEQIGLLQHTLGIGERTREPYRNYFVADEGHHDMADLEALERQGYMARARTPKFCSPGDVVFCTTDAGRALAIANLPPPPRRTRYSDFLDADTGFSFAEYLCGSRLPEFETRGSIWGKSREYRMFRPEFDRAEFSPKIVGQWAKTKKEAKATYKEALKAFNGSRSRVVARSHA